MSTCKQLPTQDPEIYVEIKLKCQEMHLGLIHSSSLKSTALIFAYVGKAENFSLIPSEACLYVIKILLQRRQQRKYL